MALGQKSTKIRPVMTNKNYETKKIIREKMEKNLRGWIVGLAPSTIRQIMKNKKCFMAAQVDY